MIMKKQHLYVIEWLFQFNVISFGLANALEVFQEFISVILEGQEDYAIPYLDDILVFSASGNTI